MGQQRQPFDKLRTGLLSDGARSYSYDHANRLTQVVSGTLTTEFVYDGAGDRVAKTVDGVTTGYVLDGSAGLTTGPAAGLTQVLVETTGGESTSYLYGHDLLAQYDSGTWAYHLNDGLGSVRQLVDPTGQVVQSYSFDPFGVPLGESGGEPYGFTEEQWDAEVDLLYLRARYLSPVVGRFTSKDPFPGFWSQPQTLNRFVYVGNNPINGSDPSGLYGKDVHFEKTKEWAYTVAHGDGWSFQGPCWPDAERAGMYAREIAQVDQDVDDTPSVSPWPGVGQTRKMHFATPREADEAIDQAIENARGFLEYNEQAQQALREFGYALNMLQDTYSHWCEGYVYTSDYEDEPPIIMERTGHGKHSARAKVRWLHPSLRFRVDEWRHELKERYPEAGVRIDQIDKDDVVDLWIRELGVTKVGKEYRYRYGYKTDKYFEFSERDKKMRAATEDALRRFFDAFGCPGPEICE